MKTKRIGILIFDGVEELQFVGPLEVFGAATRFGADCSLSTIADRSSVICRLGTRVCGDETFADAAAKDVLIVPGGPGAGIASRNAALLRFLRLPHGLVAPIASGTLIVAAAGCPSVIDGPPASSGIELALRLVERLWSRRIANAVEGTVQVSPTPQEPRFMVPNVRGLV